MNISEKFTVCFPTWNNLKYLQLFYKSLRQNSYDKNIPLVLHVNEGADGTPEWCEKNGIAFVRSDKNLGISIPINNAQRLVETEFSILLADDIYLLPNWDLQLYKVLEFYRFDDSCWIAPRLLEPINCFAPQEHPYCSIGNFGQTIEEFQEEKLLNEYKQYFTNIKKLPNGNMAIKTSVFRDLGGYDEEYISGADSQFTWTFVKKYGTSNIKQLGSALAYHFGSIVSNQNQEKKLESNRQAIELFQKKNGFFIGDITKRILTDTI